MDRNETIKTIRQNLKARSGKLWSVTGGRGTSWGWITVDCPPARSVNAVSERAELAELMGVSLAMVSGGLSIPASSAHYREYVERSMGQTPAKIAEAYWD